MNTTRQEELGYKTELQETCSGLRRLYERKSLDRIHAAFDLPSPVLEAFATAHPAGECAPPSLEERADFWEAFWKERRDLPGEGMPAAYLSEQDQGLYAGLLGASVRYMCHPENGWISSMVPPLLKDWADFENLRFDPEHPVWKLYLEQLDLFNRRRAGKWGLSHFILINGFNFVFELVGGTATYLDADERPERIRQAIDFGFDLNVRVQETFFEKVPLVAGGTLSNMGQWIPGRIVTESLDPFHMTSVKYFEEWGREPAERIFNHFDGGVIHIHANGRHLLEAASTLSGLKGIMLLNDTGYPPSHELISDFRAKIGDLPLILFIPYEAFSARLEKKTLPGGCLYHVEGVPSLDEARNLADRTKSYRC